MRTFGNSQKKKESLSRDLWIISLKPLNRVPILKTVTSYSENLSHVIREKLKVISSGTRTWITRYHSFINFRRKNF